MPDDFKWIGIVGCDAVPINENRNEVI